MPKKAPAKPKAKDSTDLPQDFESVAKRLECDEDKERFEEKLGNLARTRNLDKSNKKTKVRIS